MNICNCVLMSCLLSIYSLVSWETKSAEILMQNSEVWLVVSTQSVLLIKCVMLCTVLKLCVVCLWHSSDWLQLLPVSVSLVLSHYSMHSFIFAHHSLSSHCEFCKQSTSPFRPSFRRCSQSHCIKMFVFLLISSPNNHVVLKYLLICVCVRVQNNLSFFRN